jgi:hypothetical protein
MEKESRIEEGGEAGFGVVFDENIGNGSRNSYRLSTTV